ncbi:Orotidine 5'-phosphate decarboxylase [subsurface metagenome]|nr:bifunctional hexulose-6-phosphate synthase/ribonuclease regulator [Bacillota bacterium]
MKPILQVALDFIDLPRALKLAGEALQGGADWIEAGTPLIKSSGLDAVRELRKRFPRATLVADMKIMDVGRIEVESAAKAGADVVVVLGLASDSTIRECIEAGKHYGAKIMVDLLEVDALWERAKEVERMGADYIGVHASIDEQMEGKASFQGVRAIAGKIGIPIAVAGGVNSENAHEAVDAGANIIIVGGAITKNVDAKKATAEIKKAIEKKIKIKSELFKRVSEENIREMLSKVSSANISDAMHRQGELKGIRPVCSGVKMIGPAFTVRTYPGDWAKTVEAIDEAPQESVIVIDAGGVEPAVWGELATNSCLENNIEGVVIDGAIRDVVEIRKLKFPAFARIITPTAGEPKGFGEMGVPVKVGGVRVFPGDWVFGDDDGVVVIPQKRAVEITNRAMDVLEKENRIRKEIKQGGTLGKVTELLKWEKK